MLAAFPLIAKKKLLRHSCLAGSRAERALARQPGCGMRSAACLPTVNPQVQPWTHSAESHRGRHSKTPSAEAREVESRGAVDERYLEYIKRHAQTHDGWNERARNAIARTAPPCSKTCWKTSCPKALSPIPCAKPRSVLSSTPSMEEPAPPPVQPKAARRSLGLVTPETMPLVLQAPPMPLKDSIAQARRQMKWRETQDALRPPKPPASSTGPATPDS